MKVSYQENAKRKYPRLGQLEDGSVFCFVNDIDKTPYILIEGSATDNIYTDSCSVLQEYVVGKEDYNKDLTYSIYRPIVAMNGELTFASQFNEVIPLNATMVIEGEE